MFENETATNPVAGEDTPAPEQEVEQQAEEIDIQDGGEESDQQTTQADDTEEFEHDGQKYRIPKAVKPLLMMQADYTRKTQALAEERRAWEQQRAQQTEATQAHLKDMARLVALDEQLEQFRKLNWDQIWNQDPSQHTRLVQQFNLLKDTRDRVAGELQQKEQKRQEEEQRARATRLSESQALIAREVPGWSPELAAKLTEYAVGKGLTMPLLERIVLDMPQAVKILHTAYVGEQLIAKQKAAARPPAQKPEPVPTVSSSRAPAAKDPERMSTEEWMRWRNKQVASRR